MFRRYVLTIIGLLFGLNAMAQEIDNTTSYKNINRDSYIRFSLDNDYFSARDQQYTEGVNLEVCSPALKKNPLTWLLINPHFGRSEGVV